MTRAMQQIKIRADSTMENFQGCSMHNQKLSQGVCRSYIGMDESQRQGWLTFTPAPLYPACCAASTCICRMSLQPRKSWWSEDLIGFPLPNPRNCNILWTKSAMQRPSMVIRVYDLRGVLAVSNNFVQKGGVSSTIRWVPIPGYYKSKRVLLPCLPPTLDPTEPVAVPKSLRREMAGCHSLAQTSSPALIISNVESAEYHHLAITGITTPDSCIVGSSVYGYSLSDGSDSTVRVALSASTRK